MRSSPGGTLSLREAEGIVVGRIMKASAAPVDRPWLWTLAFGQHEDRMPTHGYEATREAAMELSPRAGGGNRPALPLARPNSAQRSSRSKRATRLQQP